MIKHAKSESVVFDISVEDFYKGIDPVLQQINLVSFQLELLKGTLEIIDKYIESLVEDEKALGILADLIAKQTKALKDSTEDLVLN
jgi:hypothetical protein